MAESRWSEKGFSLLELMVALAIFVTSIGVLLAAQTAASRHQERARNLYTATALLRELLTTAETEGLPDAGDETAEGDFGEEQPKFTWKRTVTDAYADAGLLAQAAQFGVNVDTVKAALPGIRLVTLTVLWGEGEKQESSEITYYALSAWK